MVNVLAPRNGIVFKQPMFPWVKGGMQPSGFGATAMTGGVITQVGDYTVHRLSPGDTLVPVEPTTVEYFIVGAGGGGGARRGGGGGGGGGVAMGMVEITTAQSVTGGAGGAGGIGSADSTSNGTPGQTLTFGSIATVAGGGGGAGGGATSPPAAGACGGGGGGGSSLTAAGSGFVGGNGGAGKAGADNLRRSGGGGGSLSPTDGQTSTVSGVGGNGGAGYEWPEGSGYFWGAGGGGAGGATPGVGGSSIGGDGGVVAGFDAVADTGSGGGGGNASADGGAGSDGRVVVRYKTVMPTAPAYHPHIGSPWKIQLAAGGYNDIAVFNTASWNSVELRESGNVVYDDATSKWVACYSGQDGSTVRVGLSTSTDGLTWTVDPANPVTGVVVQAEDPYFAKNLDGTMYRDGAGLAYMYCEEKAGYATQRGVELWRSGANVLTGWTLYGRVLDRGGVGTWNENDSTSPVVFWDGTQFVMLFEGRSPTQDGSTGVAYSPDGLTWTEGLNNPLIGSDEPWGGYTVPDDIIHVNGQWVLLVHGPSSEARYVASDAPADWDALSFTELIDNPLDSPANTVMFWLNDPKAVVREQPDGSSLQLYDVVEQS